MTSLKTCSNASFYFSALVLLFTLGSPLSHAGNVTHSYVDYDGDEYHLNLIMHISAPSPKVWQHLTNYKQLNKVNELVTHSEILQTSNTITRVKVVSEGCVLFFCRTITQVQDIRNLGQGYLVISEVEGQSDFSSGYTMWHVINIKQGAQVTIRARLKPDFWIPPFIGPWLFQNKLLEQGEALINKLESLTSE